MKKLPALLAGALLALTFTACDKDDDGDENIGTANQQDRNFAPQASLSNYSEISMGRIAAAQATNAGVRSFGQMMVTDHSTAQTQLATAASNARVSISADTTAIVEAGAQLMTLSGRSFDSTYLAMQVAAHDATIMLLQTEVSAGISNPLKSYAAAQLPHVQEHRRMADSLLTHL
ncbi:MAG: DUF4142 domain-containing protein [Chitinophagaceae bacterium]|nr:MAG: DUF4142 domain-containing protein [Chitinophagaceae bacterium]